MFFQLQHFVQQEAIIFDGGAINGHGGNPFGEIDSYSDAAPLAIVQTQQKVGTAEKRPGAFASGLIFIKQSCY